MSKLTLLGEGRDAAGLAEGVAVIVESNFLQEGPESLFHVTQKLTSFLGRKSALATEAEWGLQQTQLLLHPSHEPCVASQVDGARTAIVTKAESPVAGVSVAAIVLSEVTLVAERI